MINASPNQEYITILNIDVPKNRDLKHISKN